VPGVGETVQAFTDVLADAELRELPNFLLDELTVGIGPNVQGGTRWTNTAVVDWLQERWSGAIQVVDYAYIQHYELLEITTHGWQFPDGSPTRIVFHLHRYNAAMQWDLEGAWRVDFIVYW
jgi:hypothetical protein